MSPKNVEKECEVQVNPLENDIEYISSGNKIPCDYGDKAFLPYWEKDNNEIVYGVDIYTVSSIAGCGEVWICTVVDKNNKKSKYLEPNVDIFFSEKDAERKINALKKTDDIKKLSKWRRRDIGNVGY